MPAGRGRRGSRRWSSPRPPAPARSPAPPVRRRADRAPACAASGAACSRQRAQSLHRLLDALQGDHLDALDRLLRRIGLGHQRMREAELGGFAQTLLAARRRPHLAGQADFAEGDQASPAAAGCAGWRRSRAAPRDRPPARWMRTPPTALTKTSWSKQRCRHGDAARPAASPAASHSRPTVSRRGLGLCAASTSACTSTSSGRVPSCVTSTQEPDTAVACCDRNSADGLETPRRPLSVIAKTPDLVDGAEAVLDRAHQAEARMRVALEIEHGVDDVLQHARPGERAVLGDVADEDDAGARSLGEARQLRRALAHLRHRAGRRLQRVRLQRSGSSRSPPRRAARLASVARIFSSLISASTRRPSRRQLQPSRAQRHLRAGFLARHVEHRSAASRRAWRAPAAAAWSCRCRDRRRSARRRRPRVPPPSTRSNSSMPVGWRGSSRGLIVGELLQAAGTAQRSERAGIAVGRRRRFGDGLDQRVPLAAARTLSLPLRDWPHRTRCRCRRSWP